MSLYLVKHSPVEHFGVVSFIIVVGFGVVFIGLTYWADHQRQIARATNGKCNIWGKPAKVVRYCYKIYH
jgi:7-dehydrocholesterol reductase